MFAIKSYLGVVTALIMACPASAAELVMVEQTACEWCERWDEEIAPAYPKTTEGKFAPLRRVNIRDMPADLKVDRRVNFTPTFLIVTEGREVARLEGYPGPDFFWPLLADLLTKHADYDPEIAENGENG